MGVAAVSKAAAEHLLSVFECGGTAAVLEALPRLHAEVPSPLFSSHEHEFGTFGHYSGMTNMGVRVQHVHATGGLRGLADILRDFAS